MFVGCPLETLSLLEVRSTGDGDSGKGSLLSTSALELSLPGLYHIL